jgi:hypothetical protein
MKKPLSKPAIKRNKNRLRRTKKKPRMKRSLMVSKKWDIGYPAIMK